MVFKKLDIFFLTEPFCCYQKRAVRSRPRCFCPWILFLVRVVHSKSAVPPRQRIKRGTEIIASRTHSNRTSMLDEPLQFRWSFFARQDQVEHSHLRASSALRSLRNQILHMVTKFFGEPTLLLLKSHTGHYGSVAATVCIALYAVFRQPGKKKPLFEINYCKGSSQEQQLLLSLYLFHTTIMLIVPT